MGGVDWIPALVALAVGLLGGAVAWRMVLARRAPALAQGTQVARDLQAKADSLFRQLDELDMLAEKRTPEQLARERYSLELEAARALRDLEQAEESAPAPGVSTSAPPPPMAGQSGARRGFLWGTSAMAALGLLLFFVNRSAEERQQGGSVTGSLPGQERPVATEADPELAQLQAAVANAPDDLEARLALARAHLARQDLMAVWNETKIVLERSPDEPRALAYQGLVRLAMGQGELATSMVERAVAGRPDFLEGYVHLALVYSQTGRARDAEATIEKAIRLFPQEEHELRNLWSKVSNTAPADQSAELRDPHPTVAPPASPATATPMAPSPLAAEAGGVTGTVDLDPSLVGQGGGVLFVMLRPAGAAGGPPLAAQRIVAPSFPVSFHIGPADSMMGGALPDLLRVEARLDADGDPTTREPSDPAARRDPVQNGATEIVLVLQRP